MIHFNELHPITSNVLTRNKEFLFEQISNKCIVSSNEILLHVEWLAIAGKQNLPSIKSFYFHKSALNIEQQLYLSFFQSTNFNQEIQNVLCNDQIALNTILTQLIDWCRNNICECLIHCSRVEKRRQLAYFLTIIDCLLQNSSITINSYLHILSPIVLTCLLYDFEIDEPADFDVIHEESVVNTGHIWSLRILSARACVKILQRSTSLVYDIFSIRIFTRLVYSLTIRSIPPSVIHAILYFFEQLGCHVCRTFLLPYLLDIDSSRIFSSKAILSVLERISVMLIKQ
ncbi:hypothetical protein I4U23_028033 [Adineta vaga]|nr:hypothetical protein I4U23_028033 [Adineta vaga]